MNSRELNSVGVLLAIFSSSLISSPRIAFASCTFIGNSKYPNSTSNYTQNGTINCSGDLIATTEMANNTGYGGNLFFPNFISKETSQVLRWSNKIYSQNGNIEIKINKDSEVSGSGTTKGLILIHNGYYRANGNGNVDALNSRFYTPESRAKIVITNDGSIKYTATTQNTDRDTASAVSIESNDGPADQLILNNGNIYSSSAYGVLMSGLAVYGNGNTYLPLSDYSYTYNNINGIINNGRIEQDIGTISSTSDYAGHSAALTVIIPSAKQVFVQNNKNAIIKGMESGIDLLTSQKVNSSYIENYGDIIGVNEAGISLTGGSISTKMAYTPDVKRITNYKTGIINGGQHGILNNGIVGIIENYGTISGKNSIDTSKGKIDQYIGNYGILDGNVLLGGATLALARSKESTSSTPSVFGNIIGTTGSLITIGGSSDFTNYSTNGDASVDAVNIYSNANLEISNNNSWKAFGNGFSNYGIISLSQSIKSSELIGEFKNSGVIDISKSNRVQSLTINGNYIGRTGNIKVTSTWNEDGSVNGYSSSDHITINGNVSGITNVSSFSNKNEGILGDVHYGNRKSVPVIFVNGDVESTNFYGHASTIGAGEAQLAIDNEIDPKTGSKTFSWRLNSDQGSIITPDAPGYVSVAYVNIEMIRDSISNYHDRKGVENIINNDRNENFWGRTWLKHRNGSGLNRFDWKSNSTGYQIGYELDYKKENDETKTTNIYASYISGSSRAYDQLRAESAVVTNSKYAGDMKTHNINFGITRTYLNEKNKNYTDFVIQASSLRNKYYSSRQRLASNNGFGFTVSAEQGIDIDLNSNISIEPMYQLIFNYFYLKKFNDGIREVSQGDQADGLLRLGGRIYYKENFEKLSTHRKNNITYLKSYINKDFYNNGKANIGKSYILEKNSTFWGELGLGFQRGSSDNTYYFMDASIEKNIGGAYRKSYNINFGVNHRW